MGSMGLFFRQWRESYTLTGAVMPSSRALARAMVSHLPPGDGPRRLLEAGPGTGVFTEAIARRMGPNDRLDVYEINPAFADWIERRLRTEAVFKPVDGRVEIFRRSVLEMPPESHYDAIVSSLPMNNFAPGEVRAFLAAFMEHLQPGGVLSYFEYVLIRQIKGMVASDAERRRLREVGAVTSEFVRAYQMSSDAVLWNVPPAVARHLVKPLSRTQTSQVGARGLRPAAVVQ